MKMAGNPNWWAFFNNGIGSMLQHSHSHQSSYSDNTTVSVSASASADHFLPHQHHRSNQDFPVNIRSWSHLLLGGLSEEKQLDQENWEEQVLNLDPTGSVIRVPDEFMNVPQQSTNNSQIFYNDHLSISSSPSSPNSCIGTALSNSSFRPPPPTGKRRNQHSQEQSSECNSNTSNGGVQAKMPRVQPSSSQPALKVRKGKLGDRITALHQLVSPFGKTDTASVLSEAISYIKFLQGQIEVLNDHIGILDGRGRGRGRGVPNQEELGKELRSRGLCLVPISCTQHLANDGGADFWAPAAFGGGF